MGWGQWTSADLTFTECYLRASAALEAEGLKPENHGRIWFGASPGAVSATIVCFPLPHGTMVTIGASNEGGNSSLSGDMVGRLAGRIFTTETPKPAPGSPPVAGAPAAAAGSFQAGPRNGVAETGSVLQKYRNGDLVLWACSGFDAAALERYGGVWGGDNGVYAEQSYPCAAAVHAGAIPYPRAATNALVVLEVRPGLESYTASEHFGVKSQARGGSDRSFAVIPVIFAS